MDRGASCTSFPVVPNLPLRSRVSCAFTLVSRHNGVEEVGTWLRGVVGRGRRLGGRRGAANCRACGAALTRACVPAVACLEQKNNQESIAARLQLCVKSGKYTLGYRSTLKTLRSGKGACLRQCCRVPCLVACHRGCRFRPRAHGLLPATPAAVYTPMLPRAAKLVMIADNCPPLRKSEVEYYAMLAKTVVHHYTGCASACPRPPSRATAPPRSRTPHGLSDTRVSPCCCHRSQQRLGHRMRQVLPLLGSGRHGPGRL